MKAGQLICFLEGQLPGEELEVQITEELRSWRRALSERGCSAHIHLDNASPHFQVTVAQVRRLLLATLDGSFSRTAAAYLVDALLLGDPFAIDDESLRDVLDGLSENQVGGCLQEEDIREALASMPGVSPRLYWGP